MTTGQDPATGPATLLGEVVQRIGSSLDLPETLEAVARSVVELLGFEIAVLNLIDEGGDLQVVAVAGPDEIRSLIGQKQVRSAWELAVAASVPCGQHLRFLDGRREQISPSHVPFFVPDVPVPEEPDGWHPLDALFAPLLSKDGTLLGVLSVDLPRDGRRPGAEHIELLEVFALQASLVIDHARLYSALQTSLHEQQRVQSELRHRALHDGLTGLANRGLLLDRLDQALARLRRDQAQHRCVAVLFLDVDHFKLVNDSLGHGVGDELLVSLGRLLQQHLRATDTAGRLGGDEFVLVLEDLTGPAEAIAVAERVLLAVREPLVLGGQQVRTSLSVGISIATESSVSSGLLADADAALYRAKANGRGRWEVFHPEMRSQALTQLTVRRELGDALAGDQFRLHYQPVQDMRTGTVLGYEALLRWEHPVRGLLAPAAFLDVLQEGEHDSPVMEWVLERACTDAAAWRRNLFVSVNLSPRQLARPDLARRTAAVLERSGLSASRLWLEITEDRAIDANQDIADVQRLRDLGVHVALDDFGTGYAGLTYLQRLPADIVKIDRIFVTQLAEDPVSQGIVAAVVDLAKVLGLQVVAEGVEREEQREVLLDLGVHLAQGFLLGRPAELPSGGAFAVEDAAVLSEDLGSELRRLVAALATAQDLDQVAQLVCQTVRRSVGASGATFMTAHDDGLAHLVHADGYTPDEIAPYVVLALETEQPIPVSLRTGQSVWLERHEMALSGEDAVRDVSRALVALASVAVAVESRVLAAVGASWDRPIVLGPPLRQHLEAIGAISAGRLAELADQVPATSS